MCILYCTHMKREISWEKDRSENMIVNIEILNIKVAALVRWKQVYVCRYEGKCVCVTVYM